MRLSILIAIVLLPVAAFAEMPRINPAFRFSAENPNFTGRNKDWMADARTGCWLFDGNPAPGETVEWSGDCQDRLATGDGTATFYKEGQARLTIVGKFSRGSLTGQGKLVNGGDIYEGEFAFTAQYGTGVLTKANGEQYRGTWPGSGTYSLPDGTNCPALARRYQRFFVIYGSCVTETLRK